jgi:drug/metabolite transporter (DMT)-like permease
VSLVVAVPFGVAAAVAYGFSTAVQHQAAHNPGGEVDARGLAHLLRDPRWLLSIGGDFVGFLLQVVALSTGPVVLIQPLLVLTLPVSLFAGHLLGGPRPRRADYGACLAILAGLSVFFVLLGEPGIGRVPRARELAWTIALELVVGTLLCLAVGRRGRGLRAAVYGGVAGAWFGTLGVLLTAASTEYRHHGFAALVTGAQGLTPLLGLAVLGAVGMTLTQVSFQVGALASSFPANKCADPVAAVVLGALLLGERVPSDAVHLLVYMCCLAAVVYGAVRLAATEGAASETEAVAARRPNSGRMATG